MRMRVLVTGGTGFIGSHIVQSLVRQGCEVWATGSPSCEKQLGDQVVVFPHGPIGVDWPRMARMLDGRGIDVLFHLAANNDTTWDDDEEMEFSNVQASLKVFERVVRMGCRKIIYASSTAVYGNVPAPQVEYGPTNPLNAYGRSKLLLEKSTIIFNEQSPEVHLIGLRYCNVYGPGEFRKGKRASMIHQMALQIQRQPVKLFDDGEQKRDWIFVDDLVRANLLAMEINDTCVINCGSGTAVTFNRLYEVIVNVTNKRSWGRPDYVPNPHKSKYQDHVECDMGLAKRLLGFEAKYSIEAGIKEYHARGGFRR